MKPSVTIRKTDQTRAVPPPRRHSNPRPVMCRERGASRNGADMSRAGEIYKARRRLTNAVSSPWKSGQFGSGAARRWRAAAWLGLISSTFSTIVSQLSAARIGRDATVEWMVVATIPGTDRVLSSDPTAAAIVVGILFHQWADFSWALFFFGVLGRWTARLSPVSLVLIAPPWAMMTSALEWFVLVPLFPFYQPIFTLQQPYWVGVLVHLSSASIYPMYRWLDQDASVQSQNGTVFLRFWTAAAATGVLLLAIGALAASLGRELPWWGRDASVDQRFMRHMSTHHQQGIELATIAADKAVDPHLRRLANLMTASQRGENKILESWWASWFGSPMEICSSEERAAMPGLLTPLQVEELRTAPAAAFDALFVRLMTSHHAGAVAMADAELRNGSDARLRVMAHGIRHEQQGEIALMHGAAGVPAVLLASQHMLGDRVNQGR
jgi:uncharacterized protein (DUF305 family)